MAVTEQLYATIYTTSSSLFFDKRAPIISQAIIKRLK